MPQKKHLPQVTDKEQRMYEHIKESELERGRPTRRAKAIAAGTVKMPVRVSVFGSSFTIEYESPAFPVVGAFPVVA